MSDLSRLHKQSYNNHSDESEDKPLDNLGDIHIADEVISIVASLAAQEVTGVLGMSNRLTDGINRFLGKDNASRGVSLKFQGRTVSAAIYLNIEYGICIPEVALDVQERVKEAIEAMTGYEVESVDVHIEGVALRKETELERKSSTEEDMANILRAQAMHAEETEENSFEQQLANLRNERSFALPPEEDADQKQLEFLEED